MCLSIFQCQYLQGSHVLPEHPHRVPHHREGVVQPVGDGGRRKRPGVAIVTETSGEVSY